MFGSLLSAGKHGHIKKSGVECKVFIYISSAQYQLHIHRALQYKIKWNTDDDDGVWSDMRLWRQVDSLLIICAFIFSVWFSAPRWVQRHFKASANFKKTRNRPINTVQHYICNTRSRNHKKIVLYLNRPLDIHALLLSNAAFMFSLHTTDKHEYVLIYLLYIYSYIL